MDKNNQLSLKPNSSPDSLCPQSNSNSSIPTFKIENEDSGVVTRNGCTGHSEEKHEPSTSNDKDEASEHLTVPSKECRMQRSSSLKIEKSSAAETSSDKKIVRFADALGLDLVDVKIFTNDGSLPNIPSRAFSDLKISSSDHKLVSQSESKMNLDKDNYLLVPQFEQPWSISNFMNKVKEQKVCLENVLILDLKVTGIVRILNIHFEKVVLVRYTTDGWNSQLEQPAKYVEGSSDTLTDKFTFTIHPQHLKPGDKLDFVLKYEVLNQEFWDNNDGNNYTLLCKNDCPRITSKSRKSIS